MKNFIFTVTLFFSILSFATADIPTPNYKFKIVGVNIKGNFMVIGDLHTIKDSNTESGEIVFPKICFMVYQGTPKSISFSAKRDKNLQSFCEKIKSKDIEQLTKVEEVDIKNVNLAKLPKEIRRQKVLKFYSSKLFSLLITRSYDSVMSENDLVSASFYAHEN